MSAGHDWHGHVMTDDWYARLDPGIRFAVRVLHSSGIETGQSCEGGEGHAYDRPTVDLLGPHHDAEGFAAVHYLNQHGLPLRDLQRVWSIEHGCPFASFWRITFWEPMDDRADDRPGFEWGYRVPG